MSYFQFVTISLLLFTVACQSEPVSEATDRSTPPISLSLMTGANTSLPHLTKLPNGEVLLSYVRQDDTVDSLFFRRFSAGQWSAPQFIAAGENWFVNWADFPSVASFDTTGQQLCAHWLQYRGAGKYDYDVRMSISLDGGLHWGESFVLHSDGIAAEHGFVSMAGQGDGSLQVIWLDGRNTKTDETKHATEGHDHHNGGAMSLRTARILPDGRVEKEVELDPRICDCCQTDLIFTESGWLAVYRDRSLDEIRDISFVENFTGAISPPKSANEDNWQIAGCPVNGPAIDEWYYNQIALAWFTQANDTAKVQLAYWNDEKRQFGPAFRVDDGQPLGRVDVVMGQELTYVSWLEVVGEAAEYRLKYVDLEGNPSPSVTLSTNDGGRSSGFLQLTDVREDLLYCYTDQEGEVKQIICKYVDILAL